MTTSAHEQRVLADLEEQFAPPRRLGTRIALLTTMFVLGLSMVAVGVSTVEPIALTALAVCGGYLLMAIAMITSTKIVRRGRPVPRQGYVRPAENTAAFGRPQTCGRGAPARCRTLRVIPAIGGPCRVVDPSQQEPSVCGACMNRPHDLSSDRSAPRAADDDEPRLGVAVAGDSSRRVIRVNGDLTAQGAELVTAITNQFVRDGCRDVGMDLTEVTAADHEGLRSVERLRTSLDLQGVTMSVSDTSSAVDDPADD